ncbi:MAG: hypothetical protein BTN85_1456 [Candidatus Methanohalarchaeum thermophilum]|uniref:Uncharacterized protein n=1 Tax=Methanohalarchaeum thermophilum TaxID=1903181 RepID=A0A1Q6DX84_METT1|nr:MAG: hypothetical protein BTN85_1456 [Candidatus Methanohalarchaeum thermophilum]
MSVEKLSMTIDSDIIRKGKVVIRETSFDIKISNIYVMSKKKPNPPVIKK